MADTHEQLRNVQPSRDTNNAQHLSQATFANPSDFLDTLRGILPKANVAHPDSVSREDLMLYSTTGASPRERAAATIAASHYDELRSLPDIFMENGSKGPGLSDRQLAIDQALINGYIDKFVQDRQRVDRFTVIASGGVAAMAGLGAVALVEAPPLAVVFAGFSVVSAAAAGLAIYDDSTIAQRAHRESIKDQNLLGSWSELGGHRQKPTHP